jgi:hypothetical protein
VWFSNFLKYVYLVRRFFYPLSTVFKCRSSFNLCFLIYRGAFRMDRQVMQRKFWKFTMLELEAVPHKRIPWLQMGFSTALYRIHLLSIYSVNLLPSNQCISFASWVTCSLFLLYMFEHISLLSRCIHMYFTYYFWGRATLPISTVG